MRGRRLLSLRRLCSLQTRKDATDRALILLSTVFSGSPSAECGITLRAAITGKRGFRKIPAKFCRSHHRRTIASHPWPGQCRQRTGYKIIRAIVKDGVPSGEYEDFVTRFVIDDERVWGRPALGSVPRTVLGREHVTGVLVWELPTGVKRHLQRCGGVRKARFARPGTGKSGGGRAIYYVMIGLGRLYMMTAYAKSKQEDLTTSDRKAILRVIEQLLRGDQ
jgi:RelE toxin of RelEB toxin-antitoxin system